MAAKRQTKKGEKPTKGEQRKNPRTGVKPHVKHMHPLPDAPFNDGFGSVWFSSVQSLSHVQLFVTR